MKHSTTLILYLAVVLLPGCGGSNTTNTSIVGAWSLNSYGSSNPLDMLSVDSGNELAVVFSKNNTFVATTYNGFGGTYSVQGNKTTLTETGVSTLLYNPSWEPQNTEFKKRLLGTNLVARDVDTLRLESPFGELLLSNRVPDLAGTHWKLIRIKDSQNLGDGDTLVPEGSDNTIQFGSASTLNVVNNCRVMDNLTYSIDNQSVLTTTGVMKNGVFEITSDVILTQEISFCPTGDYLIDYEYRDLLFQAKHFAVVRGKLILTSDQNTPKRDLIFVQVEP